MKQKDFKDLFDTIINDDVRNAKDYHVYLTTAYAAFLVASTGKIGWIKAEVSLPEVDDEDSFNQTTRISKRVIVQYTSSNTNSTRISFAQYFEEHKHWVIEGFRGDAKVQYWCYINNP